MAVRSASNASCIDACKRFATGDEIACAQRCPGAIVDATECTPIEHGCVSDEETSTGGRVAMAAGIGAGIVGGVALSALLVYVLVAAL